MERIRNKNLPSRDNKMKDLCIAIDLDVILQGFNPKQTKILNEALEQKHKLILCSDHDLNFVKENLPDSIIKKFNAFVLEAGCVIIDKDEQILPDQDQLNTIKNLANKLDMYKIKKSKSSITIMTKDPFNTRDNVEEDVDMLRFYDEVDIINSSNSVQIIPKAFNKFVGLKLISDGKFIASIAQERSLLSYSDFAFIPKNTSPKVSQIKQIVEDMDLLKDMIVQSQKENTEAVIDVLNFLKQI